MWHRRDVQRLLRKCASFASRDVQIFAPKLAFILHKMWVDIPTSAGLNEVPHNAKRCPKTIPLELPKRGQWLVTTATDAAPRERPYARHSIPVRPTRRV